MGNDGQSAKREQAPETAQRVRSFKLLRLVVIAVILFAGVGIGLYFKLQANPGTEPSGFRNQPPQYINVYVTDPEHIKLTATVTLGQGWLNPDYERYGPVEFHTQGRTDFHEMVSFTATTTGSVAPGTIIITSSIRPLTGAGAVNAGAESPANGVSVFQLKGAGGWLTANRFAVPFPLSPGQGNTWSGSVFFDVPVILQDKGAVFGHLPSVGVYSTLYPPSALLEGVYEARTGQLRNVAIPDSYAIPAGERTVDFYPPNNDASYTEVIQHIAPALSNMQISDMSPAPDSAGDADYTWHSNSIDGLEPTFQAVDLNAADSQTQAAFYSGIAFGLAGAAVIALVQEIRGKREDESLTSRGPSSARTDRGRCFRPESASSRLHVRVDGGRCRSGLEG
jgi:hypothetical protein